MREPVCEGLQNSLRCARAIEKDRLKTSRDAAERTEDGLRLLLRADSAILIADSADAAVAKSFSYLGYLPELGYYVLHEQYIEGSAVRIVHRPGGWFTTIDDLPVVSPSGDRVAVAANDYYTRTALVVYGVQDDTLALEWEMEPDDWAPSDAFWLTEGRLSVVREYMLVCEFARRIPWHRTFSDTVRVTRVHSAWRMATPVTPTVPDSIGERAEECYQALPF